MEPKSRQYRLIRPDAFIYCFGIDLPVSFIPLYAEDLYSPILGLSKEYVMGLPISASMLLATIAFLVGGAFLDKKGWQKVHLAGILFTAAGQVISGLAGSVQVYIMARALNGFGYGLVFMAYMGFVYANTDDRNRTMGFATMSAGMFSGSICGGAVGGMLAERIGFQNVFFLAAFFVIITLGYTTLFMKQTYQRAAQVDETYGNRSLKENMKLIMRFMTNRNIFSLLVLLSIPSAITFVGVLYYISPIYLDRLGTSQANIARILMINGIFMIYVAPMLSPLMDKSRGKRGFIIASGIIGGAGMLSFLFFNGILAIIIVILMLSLSAALGNSARTVYALQQDIAKELGGGRAMSLYRTIDRIGWVIGPLLLGGVIASGQIEKGLALIGIVYIMVTLLFIVCSKKQNTEQND